MKRLRLCVDLTVLGTPQSGISRVTIHLVRELVDRCQLTGVSRSPILEVYKQHLTGTPIELLPSSPLSYRAFALPRFLRRAKIDYYLNPWNRHSPFWAPCQCGLILHDLTTWNGNYYNSRVLDWKNRINVVSSVLTSRHVFTVSYAARDGIARHIPLARRKLMVHYPGVDHCTAGPSQPRRLVLAAGGARHKHPEVAAEAFLTICDQFEGIEFAVFGSPSEQLIELAAISGGRIQLLGPVSDETLEQLYSRALVFVYLSEAEGFGMMPLEAARCGAAVIASDLPVFHDETLADGAILTSTKTDAVSSALGGLLRNEQARAELAQRGKRRAERFKWRAMADGIFGVISASLDDHRKIQLVDREDQPPYPRNRNTPARKIPSAAVSASHNRQ